jgi:hypothetical protein
MSFDFNKIRKRLVSSRTIFNVDGIYQAGLILECLELCPFVDVVAEFLGMANKDIYGKLKYYLAEDEFQLLLETLKAQRKFEIFSFKRRWKRDLENKIKR